ncbi:hypothetical protein HDU78_002567 [Chytriomyces hyalinus]|nr:hypothetical protein HDU78_002567 [Chytriomyces hyalinus]
MHSDRHTFTATVCRTPALRLIHLLPLLHMFQGASAALLGHPVPGLDAVSAENVQYCPTTFRVQNTEGMLCSSVIAALGVSMETLMDLNPSLDCSNKIPYNSYLCSSIPTATSKSPTVNCLLAYKLQDNEACPSIQNAFSLDSTAFALLNPQMDCSNLPGMKSKGEPICVEGTLSSYPDHIVGGPSKNDSFVVSENAACSRYATVASSTACIDISEKSQISITQLESLNTGLNCWGLKQNQTLCIELGPAPPASSAVSISSTTTTTTVSTISSSTLTASVSSSQSTVRAASSSAEQGKQSSSPPPSSELLPSPSPSLASQPSPSPERLVSPSSSPEPEPSPLMSLPAQPQPSPFPDAQPTSSPAPQASPSPGPQASPSPAPQASPSPAPQASPSPAAPQPSPSPPQPQPSPSPEPQPAPSPAAQPSPSPAPQPSPQPAPSPAPQPSPVPQPAPSPAPQPAPAPIVIPVQQGKGPGSGGVFDVSWHWFQGNSLDCDGSITAEQYNTGFYAGAQDIPALCGQKATFVYNGNSVTVTYAWMTGGGFAYHELSAQAFAQLIGSNAKASSAMRSEDFQKAINDPGRVNAVCNGPC